MDWLKLLIAADIDLSELKDANGKPRVPPMQGALLKNEQDIHLFDRLIFMNRQNR